MSQTAERPWWAEVEHLRPDEDGARSDDRARRPRTGRFDRRPAHRERPEPEVWLDAAEPESWRDAADPAPPAPKPKSERRTIEIRGQVDRVHGVAPVPSPGPQRHRRVMPSER